MAGSKLLGASLTVAIIALVVYGIGFASPYWFKYETASVRTVFGGLFVLCDPGGINSECVSIYNADSQFVEVWLPAADGMACFGLLCGIGGLVACVIWSCNGSSKAVCAVTALLFVLAGVFGGISTAVFAVFSEIDFEYFSWALWLTVVGSVLFLISGIISIAASCEQNKIRPI